MVSASDAQFVLYVDAEALMTTLRHIGAAACSVDLVYESQGQNGTCQVWVTTTIRFPLFSLQLAFCFIIALLPLHFLSFLLKTCNFKTLS